MMKEKNVSKSLKKKLTKEWSRIKMDLEFWKAFVNDNYYEFSALKDKAKIALLLPDTDKMIILEKSEDKMLIHTGHADEFDFPFAQIALRFSEKSVDKLNENISFNTFKNLTKNDEIGILSFVDENELKYYKFDIFLKNFGYELNSSCSCGCC